MGNEVINVDVIVFWISVVLIAVTLGIKTWLTKGQPITGWVRPNKDKTRGAKLTVFFSVI